MSEGGFRVQFTRAARKQLMRLDRPVQARLLKTALLLGRQPQPPAARKLAGSKDLWRIRTGDYRLIYRIDGHRLLIVVARVPHRRSVYRNLDEL